jgi:hypothetical protein
MVTILYNRQEGKESNKLHQAFQPPKFANIAEFYIATSMTSIAIFTELLD